MGDEIKRYRERRDARMKARADEDWITMKGTHILIDDEGQVKGGPERVRKLVGESGGYRNRKEREMNAPNANNKPPRAGKYIESLEKLKKGTAKADDWKKQLKSMADKGEIPASITGSKEQQAEVMKEVNNLYQKPDIDHTFYDQGDGAYIIWKDGSSVTSRISYPSGKDASQEEKDGVVKYMMLSHQKKFGKQEKTKAEEARERMVGKPKLGKKAQ